MTKKSKNEKIDKKDSRNDKRFPVITLSFPVTIISAVKQPFFGCCFIFQQKTV